MRRTSTLLLMVTLAACANSPPPPDKAAPATSVSATVSSPVASASAPTAEPILSASATASASAVAAPSATASAAVEPAPVVADNKVNPVEDADLQTRAKALFEGIVKDDAAIAEPLWFPREPFNILKDIKDPEKYWKQLHKAYAKDVHKLHESRSSWDGATFVRFERGSAPKWVKPGEEGNKIGYYRSFHGKLVYSVAGAESSMEVRVVITWQGKWYITHLSKFK
jgi:hypothetical protein